MKIAILGTGMVGKTMANKLSELGHDVTIGTRDVEQTMGDNGNAAFKEWHASQADVKVASLSDAAAHAEVIFNCTSGMGSLAALTLAGEANLNGKLLIDIANPLDFSQGMPPSLNPVNTDSLGEQIQNAFPQVRVVKTLNTMSAYVMVNPALVKGDHTVFLCGNDEKAKDTVKSILKAFGWGNNMIIDLGDISNARGTEMLLPIWLRLWGALGTAEFNFHIQRN